MTADAGRQFAEAVGMFGIGCIFTVLYYTVQILCNRAKFDYAMRFVLEFFIAAVCGGGAIIALIYLADGAVKFYHPLCFACGILSLAGVKNLIGRIAARKRKRVKRRDG